jgi:hypothetical protein
MEIWCELGFFFFCLLGFGARACNSTSQWNLLVSRVLQLQDANFGCSLVDLYCMGLLKELDLGVDSQVFWGFLGFRVYNASLSIA